MQEVSHPKHTAVEDDFSDSKNQPESVAAVLKVFAIMQALSEQNVIGVTELSVRLAMPTRPLADAPTLVAAALHSQAA